MTWKVFTGNCRNSGTVTGFGQVEAGVQSLYASEGGAHKAQDPSCASADLTVCDQASKDASAGATVNYVPKANWSNATILSWLQ